MNPLLVSGGLSLLGGIFGGGQQMPAGQRNLLRLQHRAARELQDYSHGVPGSDPQELAALASQRGLIGQQQRATMGGLFANLGGAGSPAPMDLLSNLAMQFGGQQSAATSGLFGQFLQNRRNALLQSAQIAAGAVPASQMPQGGGLDFGSILGNLGQQYGYQQALKLQPRQQGTVYPVTPATQRPRSGLMGLF